MTRKRKSKAVIAFTVVMVIIAAVATTTWFSISSEQRNMMAFMLLNGDKYDNYQVYQVIDRNDKALTPASFTPRVAKSVEGDLNTNIVAITEMVKNENSKMLKKGMVQATGRSGYTGWHLMADEGAAEEENPFGPSPLSYYTSGIAANLHTQILRAAKVMGVELESVKVEVLNKFRWHNMMSTDGAGFLDVTTTNIIIESDVSKEVIQEIKGMALRAWTAGESLKKETVIEPSFVVNKKAFDYYHATPGKTLSEVSFVDGLKLSAITAVPQKPIYLKETIKDDVAKGFSFDDMSNLEFEIFAISESVKNAERPYLNKITLSTPSPETWEIYADEFMGAADQPIAPTSLEYFTVGTALCLTSQTTLVSAMMGLDFKDYRVENQMDYRQEAINTSNMVGYTDIAHSSILMESDESQERLELFYKKSLSLCFAGEGLKNATEMHTYCYLNGVLLK